MNLKRRKLRDFYFCAIRTGGSFLTVTHIVQRAGVISLRAVLGGLHHHYGRI
jgi:hypothetical protein